jgi:hypothetical protein
MMTPGGQMLQYTYSLVSPIPEAQHGLKGRRVGFTFLNVPPAAAPVAMAMSLPKLLPILAPTPTPIAPATPPPTIAPP